MLWQRDQWVRRVYIDRPAFEYVKPPWYGRVHRPLENGELVVDTVGLAANKNSYIDMYRSPHTEKLHVVNAQGHARQQILEPSSKIENEDTFNEPMYMTSAWRRDSNDWLETICGETYRPLQRKPGSVPQAERRTLIATKPNKSPPRSQLRNQGRQRRSSHPCVLIWCGA